MAAPAIKLLMAAGGGGGPVQRTPPVTSNLWAHFDASYSPSITHSSNQVTDWNDLSGNGRHLTQATGGARPETNTRTLNGHNVIDFAGGEYMHRTAAIGFTTGAYTIFLTLVCDADSSSFLRFLSFHNGSGNDFDNNNALAITQGNTSALFWIFQGSVSLSDSGGAGATTTGTWSVRKTTAASGYQIKNPGGTDFSTTNSGSGTANGGFVVGAGYESGVLGTNSFNGALGELIIYSTNLNDTDRDSVRTYMSDYWGA